MRVQVAPFAEQVVDLGNLVALVVEVQDDDVVFPAVDARVRAQVVDQAGAFSARC